ncbi:HAD-IA family hydrolase [Leifsonia sp. EB34]|uniref:HAD-IA family hydrolase n=1 Tax=Leifsonia sp. EB34 TaxID=3156303 RepID=UPI0035193786
MGPLLQHPVTAAVLDMDGVITDTRGLHLRAWTQLFDAELHELAPGGGAFTPTDYELYVDGRSREDGIRTLLAARGVGHERVTAALVGRLAERKQHLFEDLLRTHGATVLPGALQFLRALRAAGIRVALATASRNAGLVLGGTGAMSLLDAVVDGTDAAQLGMPSKPDPALFREACRRLDTQPAHALLVEDSEAGIAAAASAGFGLVVGVADDPRRAAALRRADADVVVPGLHALDVTASGVILLTDAAETWVLRYDGYDEAAESTRESLCTVANGYWGTRGAAEEATTDRHHAPGTYLAGVFDMVDDGGVRAEEIVNAPNWLRLTFRPAGGDWLRADRSELLEYRQELDLRQGVLRRLLTVRDDAGRETTLRFRRLLSQAEPRLGALQATVVARNWSGPLTVRSGIDAAVRNTSTDTATTSPDRTRRHLALRSHRELSADTLLVDTETLTSGVRISQAQRTRSYRGGVLLPAASQYTEQRGLAFHEFTVDLQEGEPVVIEKVVGVSTSRDRATGSPDAAVEAMVSRAPRFAELLTGHARRWEELWTAFAVEVQPPGNHSLALNVNTFHVIQTLARPDTDLDAGVPARGLHGEAYGGHVFWDELFVYPLLTLRRPALSRGLLAYRHRRLPEALRAAADADLAGAMFPWQSATTGEDVTPDRLLNPLTGRWTPDHSRLQRHVGLAIAYSAWQFYQTTGDAEYLAEEGAELIVGVARFFTSLAEWDDALGRYSIQGVMGPDEFHDGPPDQPGAGLKDNVYTNVMTAWVLLRAIDTVRLIKGRPDPVAAAELAVSDDELTQWARIAAHLRIVFNADGTLSQFDGYDRLAPIDLDRYRQRYPTSGRLDLVLNAEGDTTNRYQVSKQPDSLMLLYLLSAEELRELLEQMGYALDADTIVRTVERYSRSSTYGSTLSNVVHSWLEARRDRSRSWQFLERTLQSDLADIQGGTTRHGIHLAAMAGSVDLLVRCYAGLETRSDTLWLHPLLPAEIESLRFTILYRSQRIAVSITQSSIRLESSAGDADPVRVIVEGQAVLLHTEETRDFAL